MYSMEDITIRETCLTEVKNVTNLLRGTLWWISFCFFFCFNKFSAKGFSVLLCYFMKREDSIEKRWNLKLTFSFRGWSEIHFINFPKNGKHRWIFSLWRWFWCSHNYNWLLVMIDKDDITTVNVEIQENL